MTTPWQPSDGLLIDPATVTAPAFTADQVTAAVAVASATIIGITGRQLMAGPHVDLLEMGSTGVQLAAYPVTEVASVEVSGDGVTWSVLDAAYWRWHARGWIDAQLGPVNMTGGPGVWGSWPLLPDYSVQVRVTYTAGYATLPADLAAVAQHLATAYLLNPLGETEIKVGELTDKYDPKLLATMPPWVSAILGRYTNVGMS